MKWWLVILATFLTVQGCVSSATPTPTPALIPTLTPSPNAVLEGNLPPQGNLPSVRLDYALETIHYPVTGTTTREIFDSVEANGPDLDEEFQGHLTAGLAESDSSYEIKFLDYGEYCELQSALISLNLIVTLPQHSSPSSLSDLQSSRWEDFADGVAVHEQHHVDIHVERAEAFKDSVEHLSETFSDCDALEARVTSIWDRESLLNDQQQEAFHQSEEQFSQRLRGPVQQQIDDSRLQLDEYQDELTLVSSEIEELEVQIDDIEMAMQPYDAQMTAIQDRYPDLVLPPDTFDEYERLRAERNGLNDLRDGVVTRVNTLVQQHNQTIEKLNQLTEQTNQLIDGLAWLP